MTTSRSEPAAEPEREPPPWKPLMTAEQHRKQAELLLKRGGPANGDLALHHEQIACLIDARNGKGKAEDEWNEAKHPRGQPGNAGQFGSGGGGGAEKEKPKIIPTSEPELAAAEPTKKFKTKTEHVKHLLTKEGGTTVKDVLAATGWPSVSMPQMAKVLGLKLQKTTEGGKNLYKGVPMTEAEKAESKKPKAAAPAPPPAAPAPAPAPPVLTKKPPEGPPPPTLPTPTPAELAQAKKSTAYPGSHAQGPEAQKIVAEFNKKYANKQLAQPSGLAQKVVDFKKMKSDLAAANAKYSAQQAAATAAAEKAEAGQHAKELAEITKTLGLPDEFSAAAVSGMAQMIGVKSAELMSGIKKYQAHPAKQGTSLNDFEYAMLRSYIGSGYAKVNKALRSPSWTSEMYAVAKVINSGLAKMPKYSEGGTLRRGAHLTTEQQQAYVVGNVVEERAFTSTSAKSTGAFSGNMQYHITKTKTARDIRKLNPDEGEVLFPAKTMFKVTKVSGQPGSEMHVHMEEVDPFH